MFFYTETPTTYALAESGYSNLSQMAQITQILNGSHRSIQSKQIPFSDASLVRDCFILECRIKVGAPKMHLKSSLSECFKETPTHHQKKERSAQSAESARDSSPTINQ